MLGKLIGGLVSPEAKAKAIEETIKDALEDASEEFKLSPQELFFMIQPVDKDFNFAIFIYKSDANGVVKLRETNLTEIIGDE